MICGDDRRDSGKPVVKTEVEIIIMVAVHEKTDPCGCRHYRTCYTSPDINGRGYAIDYCNGHSPNKKKEDTTRGMYL